MKWNVTATATAANANATATAVATALTRMVREGDSCDTAMCRHGQGKTVLNRLFMLPYYE